MLGQVGRKWRAKPILGGVRVPSSRLRARPARIARQPKRSPVSCGSRPSRNDGTSTDEAPSPQDFQTLVPVVLATNSAERQDGSVRYVVVQPTNGNVVAEAPQQQGLQPQLLISIANAVAATAFLLFACLVWMKPALQKMEEASEAAERASLEFEETCQLMQKELPALIQQVQSTAQEFERLGQGVNKPLEGLTGLAQTEKVVDTANDSISKFRGSLRGVGEELGYIRSEIETDIGLRAQRLKDLQEGEFNRLIEAWTRNWLELEDNAAKKTDANLNRYVDEFTEALRKAWSETDATRPASPTGIKGSDFGSDEAAEPKDLRTKGK